MLALVEVVPPAPVLVPLVAPVPVPLVVPVLVPLVAPVLAPLDAPASSPVAAGSVLPHAPSRATIAPIQRTRTKAEAPRRTMAVSH